MKPISTYREAADLRALMANAKRLNKEDIYRQAFLRLCEVEGLNYSDPLEREFYATLTAYEEVLAAKHGRRQPAARTRQKLKNKGFVACLEDWALGERRTDGFETLEHGSYKIDRRVSGDKISGTVLTSCSCKRDVTHGPVPSSWNT